MYLHYDVAPVGSGRGFVIAMSVAPLDGLRARLRQLTEEAESLRNTAEQEARDLTEDELGIVESNLAEIEKLARDIQARERIEQLSAGTGRQTVSDPLAAQPAARPGTGAAPRTVPATPRVDSRTGGFRSLGDFAQTVYQHDANDAEMARNRLMAMGEGTGEEGGFLVPPEFREGIMQIVAGEDSLMARCDVSTTARNSVVHNVDEETPWGTAGIRAYWEGEARAAAASGTSVQPHHLRLNKLFARVDASDELLEDAPQLDALLRRKTPEVMTSTINLAIVQGNGVGKPLGFMSSGALVTVDKALSQPADTIFHRNLVGMMARSHGWPRAIWLMHHDVWGQLPLLSFRDIGAYPSTADGTPVPIFIPPGLLSSAPFGTLLGRPIMVLEAMNEIGDLGDIALCDMSQYRVITKAGGMRTDTSIHLKFDTDETVFRFIWRLAGAPWPSKPISPRDGTNTRSPFVTLASR